MTHFLAGAFLTGWVGLGSMILFIFKCFCVKKGLVIIFLFLKIYVKKSTILLSSISVSFAQIYF